MMLTCSLVSFSSDFSVIDVACLVVLHRQVMLLQDDYNERKSFVSALLPRQNQVKVLDILILPQAFILVVL